MRGPFGSLTALLSKTYLKKALPPSLFAEQWRTNPYCIPPASRPEFLIEI
jgi:hypothetical protein